MFRKRHRGSLESWEFGAERHKQPESAIVEGTKPQGGFSRAGVESFVGGGRRHGGGTCVRARSRMGFCMLKHLLSGVCHFVIVLLLCSLMSTQHVRAQTSSASRRRATSGIGKTKIFIPSALASRYWVYVNGHLVSSHQPMEPSSTGDFIVVAKREHGIGGSTIGWEVWNQDGLLLGMLNEQFTGLDSFLRNHADVAAKLFEPLELSLRPGKYSLELVIPSSGWANHSSVYAGSFPFAVTRAYELTVHAGAGDTVYIALPNNWSNSLAAAARPANGVCPSGTSAQPPDLNQLQRWVNDYSNDPMLGILRAAVVSRSGMSRGVSVLDLPPSVGGTREFDGEQIREIVAAVHNSHFLPEHREVVECMEKAPQFSRTYTQYDLLIKDIDSEIRSFNDFAGELERKRTQ